MKYYAVVLLMYLPCESVIGQIPPIFGAQVPSFPTEPILGPGSINDICRCNKYQIFPNFFNNSFFQLFFLIHILLMNF